MPLEFEWDPAKDASHFEKHGVTFLEALLVFVDVWVIVREVTKPEYRKERFLAIGAIERGMIAVIYIDRIDKRRIISARKARQHERKQYDHSQTIARRDDSASLS